MSRTARHRAAAHRGPPRAGRTGTRGRRWRALATATMAAVVVAGCSDDSARRSDGRQQGPDDPVPVTLATGPSSPAAALSSAPRPPSAAQASTAARTTAAPSPSATAGARRPTTAAASPRTAASPRPRPATTPPAPQPSPSPAPSPSPHAASRALTIQNFEFSPRTMTVDVGTSVTATNLDSAVHTWTADAGAWDSGSLAQGQKFTFTFRAAGTYTFHCEPHPTMTGSIVVS